MPSVSYIITVFNKSPFLPHVVEGLRRQEGDFEREFIFVDDGSTDDSVAILRRLTADLPNVAIVEQENQGPGPATNAGLHRASGDFIKLVDGDDVLLPWATRSLLDAIEETGCHAAYAPSVLAGSYDPAGSGDTRAVFGQAPRRPARPQRKENTLALFLECSRTNPTGLLVKRESMRKVGGCDAGIFVQDYHLNLRLAALGDFAEIPATLFLMPEARQGRLSNQTAQEWHDTNLALAKFVESRPDLSPRTKRRVFADAAKRAMRWADRASRRKRYFLKEYWIYRLARSGLLRATPARIHATCAAFRASPGLRRVNGTTSEPKGSRTR